MLLKIYIFISLHNIVLSISDDVLFQKVEKSVPFKKIKVHYNYSTTQKYY